VTWLAFIAALAKALPVVLDLVSRFKASADAKAAQGGGCDQAVADGIKLMTKQLGEIDVAVEEARTNQAAHPSSDDGRDTQFRRD
jgi:hypothetical protein